MAYEIQFLLYSMPDEDGKVQVVIKDETIWCTQKYKDGGLSPDTTVAKIATVVNRGIRGKVEEFGRASKGEGRK